MSQLIIRNVLIIVTLTVSLVLASTWSMPVLARPCCSDLNCEGNYRDCKDNCLATQPGVQSCMDDCTSDAMACARTNCDLSCGGAEPCWFASWNDYCGSLGNRCIGSSECRPYMICNYDVGGYCQGPACVSNGGCPPGHICNADGLCQ